jgi:hypothetical protein
MKRHRFYRWLIRKFPFRKFQDKRIDNCLSRIIVYTSFVFICFTFYFSLFILLFMYLGIIIYRKSYFEKIGNKIRKQFHRSFWKKTHYFFGLVMIFSLLLLILFILTMLFTIPILILILLGYRIEKKRFERNNQKRKTYVIKYQNFDDIEKKESKTIESL